MTPIHDASGRLSHYVGVQSDITELVARKRAELTARHAAAVAEAATEAKSQFLARMSHEIRTPLNGLIAVGQLLAESPLTPAQWDLVNTIRCSGEALLTLVTDILDFSRAEADSVALTAAPFCPQGAVEAAVEISGSLAARKKLHVAYRMANSVPPVLIGDGARLQQVLLNVLNNAVKFTDAGCVLLEVWVEKGSRPPRTKRVVASSSSSSDSNATANATSAAAAAASAARAAFFGGIGNGTGGGGTSSGADGSASASALAAVTKTPATSSPSASSAASAWPPPVTVAVDAAAESVETTARGEGDDTEESEEEANGTTTTVTANAAAAAAAAAPSAAPSASRPPPCPTTASSSSCSSSSRVPPGSVRVQFSVRDTGIGLAPTDLPRLFRSFSQVDASPTRRHGGSGLGLAISQKLCEAMGGRMVASSPGLGKGSEFRWSIVAKLPGPGDEALPPLPPGAVVSPPPPPPPPPSSSSTTIPPSLPSPSPSPLLLSGKRVLLAEPCGTVRAVIAEALRKWGAAAVCSVGSEGAAIAKLRLRPGSKADARAARCTEEAEEKEERKKASAGGGGCGCYGGGGGGGGGGGSGAAAASPSSLPCLELRRTDALPSVLASSSSSDSSEVADARGPFDLVVMDLSMSRLLHALMKSDDSEAALVVFMGWPGRQELAEDAFSSPSPPSPPASAEGGGNSNGGGGGGDFNESGSSSSSTAAAARAEAEAEAEAEAAAAAARAEAEAAAALLEFPAAPGSPPSVALPPGTPLPALQLPPAPGRPGPDGPGGPGAARAPREVSDGGAWAAERGGRRLGYVVLTRPVRQARLWVALQEVLSAPQPGSAAAAPSAPSAPSASAAEAQQQQQQRESRSCASSSPSASENAAAVCGAASANPSSGSVPPPPPPPPSASTAVPPASSQQEQQQQQQQQLHPGRSSSRGSGGKRSIDLSSGERIQRVASGGSLCRAPSSEHGGGGGGRQPSSSSSSPPPPPLLPCQASGGIQGRAPASSSVAVYLQQQQQQQQQQQAAAANNRNSDTTTNSATATAADATENTTNKKSLRILLAEDNLINMKVAVGVLARMGHCDVTVAPDGQAALDALEAAGGPDAFELVLMDLHMPRKDGLEAVAELRARWPQLDDTGEGRAAGAAGAGAAATTKKKSKRLRVVAVTADAFDDTREHCLSAGFDGWLSKPFRIEDLARVLTSEEGDDGGCGGGADKRGE